MTDQTFIRFPDNFVWGASTSAHQVEGGNTNNWSEWEHQNADRLARAAEAKFKNVVKDWEKIKDQATDPANYISGNAADHYHRYKEDIGLMKSLNFTAYRFSLEWSRLEPEPGQWNQEAINHYRSVLQELRQNSIEPFVTLWHRTDPLWISRAGGWENPDTVEHYLNYVKRIMNLFGTEVKFWMPLNEPLMSLAGGYLGGVYPPDKKNPWAALKVFKNFVRAHNSAYRIIHQVRSDAQVGLPHAAVYVETAKHTWYNRLLIKLISYFANWRFLNAVTHHLDFIGVQYYTRGLINLRLGPKLRPAVTQIGPGPKTDMGWEIYPPGIYYFIKQLWQRYHKPIYITENGVTDMDDTLRAQFIKDHLEWIHKALAENIDVRGYFYWSLLDNLEWDKGFWPRFGLLTVNRETFERGMQPSAQVYAQIIKDNAFTVPSETN